LTIHKQTVLVHPILDEFYNDDPNHDRSSVYALSKGLAPPAVVSPKKSTAVPETDADGTSIDALARNAAQISLAS
jgi:glutamine amidotransferase